MGSRRQSVSGVTQNIIMKKYTLIMFALMAVTACAVGSPQRKKISVKAPSPFENYGCQCDNYTWQDTYGKIQVWDIALIVTRTAIHLWWCRDFLGKLQELRHNPWSVVLCPVWQFLQ